jgi:hypothetical protein
MEGREGWQARATSETVPLPPRRSYDVEGRRIVKAPRKDRLQALLDRNDSRSALRTIYDPYNDEEITLSREELAMVMRIRSGQFPHVEVRVMCVPCGGGTRRGSAHGPPVWDSRKWGVEAACA